MLVAELHQVLMDHELTCHRTCFSLCLGGAVLDNLTELQCIQGLREREVIKVVEVSYTVRDAHLHLRHVKNLLRSLDQSEAYNGLNECSVSHLNFITQKSKEHYRPVGGDTAAHVAALRDLRGTQAYASLHVKGLHTLGTTVVDYRGVRVIAQTIVPGLLEKTQEQPLVYGSSDYGTTVYTHPRFVELLDKTNRSLRIQHHTVLDHTDSPVELCSGVETKGIFGNDGRAYILDLLRTFPPDLNFQMTETEAKPGEVIPKECVQFGYSRHCRHRLASHRPELIEAFTQHRQSVMDITVTANSVIDLKDRRFVAIAGA